MQKEPRTFAEKLNAFFTTRVLVSIIAFLVGILYIRLLRS
jgi:hypothetical protein